MGDPDYDALSGFTPQKDSDDAPRAEQLLAMRDIRGDCMSLSELEVDRLPGTRREVETAAQTWEAATGEAAELLLDAQASEYAFKEKAPGKRIIHLATHGYFLGDGCDPDSAASGREGTSASNPLLMSGLLLAGANSCCSTNLDLGGEDGVLTAYEVSAMNLKGLEAVVLSACETGLGRVREGEGVYGLRRAFQMAGARTVVSALWPVSDEATARLMQHLYGETETPKADLFREIQLGNIESLREQGLSDHPFTWAPFIALGDWE
jgi:CHAT domain-containing protein